jgi:hypothetical protein
MITAATFAAILFRAACGCTSRSVTILITVSEQDRRRFDQQSEQDDKDAERQKALAAGLAGF